MRITTTPMLLEEQHKLIKENIIELDEDSSATHTDNGEDNRDDDDDDDDDNDSGGGGREPQIGGGGMSESFMPDTYPYPYVSQSQDTVKDRGKSPIIEEEEEEDETHEEEEDDEELLGMDSIQRQSSWPIGNLNIYAQPFSPQYTPQPPPIRADSYVYIFGYPLQYGYGYGQSSNDYSNNENNVEELSRHSFWW